MGLERWGSAKRNLHPFRRVGRRTEVGAGPPLGGLCVGPQENRLLHRRHLPHNPGAVPSAAGSEQQLDVSWREAAIQPARRTRARSARARTPSHTDTHGHPHRDTDPAIQAGSQPGEAGWARSRVDEPRRPPASVPPDACAVGRQPVWGGHSWAVRNSSSSSSLWLPRALRRGGRTRSHTPTQEGFTGSPVGTGGTMYIDQEAAKGKRCCWTHRTPVGAGSLGAVGAPAGGGGTPVAVRLGWAGKGRVCGGRGRAAVAAAA